ncbi:leucyl aminopeptidase [Candidatus Babeliales bacterium]|nr:leucyl aminopeptidase [Candidatus Babeliales bacterium]
MLKFTVSSVPLLKQNTEGYVFFLEEDFKFDAVLKDASSRFFPHLQNYFKDQKFTGKKGQTLAVHGFDDKNIKHLLFIGLGKKDKVYSLEQYRKSVALAYRLAEKEKISTYALTIPAKSQFGWNPEYLAQKTSCISLLAAYHFDDYLSEDAKVFKPTEMVMIAAEKDHKDIKEGIKIGTIIATATNRSRHWVDLPANELTPPYLAKRAVELGKKHGLEVTVFDEKKIEKLGMGGLKAVGMGSQHDSHLVIMQYKTKKKNAPTIALVGKGITFDSGGYNLKPTGYMETMKEDMTGAAGVINAIVALSELKPDVNVVALAPLAENMVSGNANHPGDIIRFYNGKTAMVGNTDAEGRLVLADALAYASKNFNPIAMIDIATLTGAASHAVGPFFSCVLTQNDSLATKVYEAGVTSGDATWRLPFIDEYKVMVKSDVADLCNNGKTKYYAGPTNGACFLSNFVGETPWVHLDIAPAAFDVPDTPYYRSGATGAGTRILIDFVMQWK